MVIIMEKKFEFSKVRVLENDIYRVSGIYSFEPMIQLVKFSVLKSIKVSQKYSYRLLQTVLESFSPLNFFLFTSKIFGTLKTHYTLVVTDLFIAQARMCFGRHRHCSLGGPWGIQRYDKGPQGPMWWGQFREHVWFTSSD